MKVSTVAERAVLVDQAPTSWAQRAAFAATESVRRSARSGNLCPNEGQDVESRDGPQQVAEQHLSLHTVKLVGRALGAVARLHSSWHEPCIYPVASNILVAP